MQIDENKIELTLEQKEVVKECRESLKKHRQAAILLGTGGGKSYIAAKLIRLMKGYKDNYNILWISTKNSIDRTKILLSREYFNCIKYVSFDTLAIHEEFVDSLNIKKFNIIIIDEAHKALACCTNKGIRYTLDKYKNAYLIAMTATKQRHSDRKKTFDELTPKLELGVDYKDRGLKYCVDNKLTCDFLYKSCDMNLLYNYCEATKQLKSQFDIYDKYQNLIEKTERLLKDYENNKFSKLSNILRDDMTTDGSRGDRWFVFFNSVDELKENIQNIKNMFKDAYNNPELTINIIEYHYKILGDEVIEQINSEPKENNVDVILTCNRGVESLHPKNTVGEIIFRRSASIPLIEQMIGRCLEAAEFSSGTKLIYDCVSNYERVQQYNARVIFSKNNLSSIADSLYKKYGDSFNTELMDTDIEDVLRGFDEVKALFVEVEQLEKINIIFSNILGEDYTDLRNRKLFNPWVVLSNYDLKHGTNYHESFRNIQLKFIQGVFGDYRADQDDYSIKKDTAYNNIYGVFGDVLYLNGDTTVDFKELLMIADEVKSYNFDYTNRISKTKKLKNSIAKIRALNMEGKLNNYYKVFCIRNVIDINGEYTDLIKEALECPIPNPRCLSDFKALVKIMKQLVKNPLENETDKETMRKRALDVLSKIEIFFVKYQTLDYGKQTINALKITYKEQIDELKKFTRPEETLKEARLIKSIHRLYLFRNSEEQDKMMRYGEELPILEVIKRAELDRITDFELFILENMGISVMNSHRMANLKKVVDKTAFGIAYNKFIKDSDEKAYKIISKYDTTILPMYIKQQLNTRKFKQSKEELERNNLMSKDNKEIQQIVSELYYPDDDSIQTIQQAIKNKQVDPRSLIKYALPVSLYNNTKNIMDKVLIQGWLVLTPNEQSILKQFLSKDDSCCSDIITNLLEADLIPEIQKEFASEIVNMQ